MPRDSSGNYTLPPGNPVVDGTIIDVNWANPTMDDIAVQLNNVLTRDGLLSPVTPFYVIDGTEALPGLAFNSQHGTGLWKDATQFGFSYQGSKTLSLNANKAIVGGGTVGSVTMAKGDATHSGYIEFYSITGNRQGYIGDSATDTTPGTLPYVAALHAFLGTVQTSDALLVAENVGSGSAQIEVGGNRVADGPAYIDFHSVAGAVDYNYRILRETGANGETSLRHTGTGFVNYFNEGAANHRFAVSGANRFEIAASQALGRDHLGQLALSFVYGNNPNSGYIAFVRPDTGVRLAFIGNVPSNTNSEDCGDLIHSAGRHLMQSGGTLGGVAMTVGYAGVNNSAQPNFLSNTFLPAGSDGYGFQISPQANEPTTYRIVWRGTCFTTGGGYPDHFYDFILNQYNGFNGASCRVQGPSGQWQFAVATGIISSAHLKSNWAYETGGLVDGLAAITDVGAFDIAVSAASPAVPAHQAQSPSFEFPQGVPSTPALPSVPARVLRQVGVTAEALQAVMPDAVSPTNDGSGGLCVAYGNAALVAAVALAKRVKAIEAFVGL